MPNITWTEYEVAVVRDAIEHLPERCRYHGDDLEWGLRREVCCDTGKPALARRRAEAALRRAGLIGGEG